MTRSLRMLVVGLSLAVAAAAVASVATVTHMAVRAWDWGANCLTQLVVAAADPFKVEAKNLPGPRVVLLRAKQYVLRQIKRERPDVTPGWRMAPST